jgi:hypothetical protein
VWACVRVRASALARVCVFYTFTFKISNIFFLNAIFFLGSCDFLLNRAKIGALWLSLHQTICLLSSNLTRHFWFIHLKTYTSEVYTFAHSCRAKCTEGHRGLLSTVKLKIVIYLFLATFNPTEIEYVNVPQEMSKSHIKP